MKQLFLAILLLSSHFGFGQASNNNAPFRVLYAEHTTNKTGVEVQCLDHISADEVQESYKKMLENYQMAMKK